MRAGLGKGVHARTHFLKAFLGQEGALSCRAKSPFLFDQSQPPCRSRALLCGWSRAGPVQHQRHVLQQSTRVLSNAHLFEGERHRRVQVIAFSVKIALGFDQLSAVVE